MPTPSKRSSLETMTIAQKLRQDTLWDYFQTSPIPLKVVREGDDLVHYNAAFGRLLGEDLPDVIMVDRVRDIVADDDLEKIRGVYQRAFEGRQDHRRVEARLKRRDDTPIWVQEIVVAQRSSSSNSGDAPYLALIICIDISAQKEVEQRIGQAERMRSIGRLTSSVAHDFSNILTILSSYADLLQNELEPEQNDALLGPLKKIQNGIARGISLTQQLAEYGCDAPQENLDLNAQIESINSLLSHHFTQNFSILLDLSPDLPPVRIAPGKLDQILLNLALNARDAMSDGGELVLRTQTVRLREAEMAAFPKLQAGEYVLLEVCDDGEGIPFELQKRIFEPFFTTKSELGSSGLGLATVYGILEQINGTIYVDSVPGEGTRFSLYMPVAPDSNADNGPKN